MFELGKVPLDVTQLHRTKVICMRRVLLLLLRMLMKKKKRTVYM